VKADLLIVDEIGPLEMQWRGFFPVLSLLPRARHCLLVIRPDLVAEVSKLLALDDSYQMAIVTPETRDERLDDLAERFGQAIARGKWS
jgi:nucleoside-triphosphatase THEP1